jgi:predicted metal-dependent hydrolase
MKYTLKRSVRAKYMRLVIHPGGALVVVAPSSASLSAVERFIEERKAWIMRTVERLSRYTLLPRGGKRQYAAHKDAALVLARERLARFNRQYGFAVGKVRVGNQKSRWGSCNKKGDLSFNYRLMLLPEHLQDYVIVHELCHIKEFNHSAAFWALVAQTLPHWKELRKELRTMR